MFRHEVSTDEIGIAARGKCILRTSASFSTSDPTAAPVASVKKPKSIMFISRRTG